MSTYARPPKYGQSASSLLTVRVTPEQLKELRRRAQEAGTSMSAYVRRRALDGPGFETISPFEDGSES